ncbi:MAG: hypothetical protein L0206_07980 [Actinobacteria bacterium]|nr:hypothetical protein [Actinomycetota bacterium]
MAVIEIARFRLKADADPTAFADLDRGVQDGYVTKQPGFRDRESGAADDGEWVVVVHWATSQDADASMEKFATDPLAADFMALIDTSTMSMKRFEHVNP